jgi:hypothetical protein
MRPNSERAKFAIISLYFMMGITVLSALSTFLDIVLIHRARNGHFLSPENFEMYGLQNRVVPILYDAIYVLCGVFFILWFTRAYKNCQLLMPNSKFNYRYWVAAVTWFVPIWNLIGPYQIATNLFDKTERYLVNEERMDLRPNYDIVKGWWWALWIMSAVVMRMSSNYQTGNPLSLIGPIANFIGLLISILCAIFAIKMIRNYREMEELIETDEGVFIDFTARKNDLLDS